MERLHMLFESVPTEENVRLTCSFCGGRHPDRITVAAAAAAGCRNFTRAGLAHAHMADGELFARHTGQALQLMADLWGWTRKPFRP